MVRYSIEFSSRAYRQFAKLDPAARARLAPEIDALADDPRPAGAIVLRGSDGTYRLRVGTYRVVFTIEDEQLVVLVVKIGHRRDVYRER